MEAGTRLRKDALPACRMYQISHLFVYAGLESEGTGAMGRDLIKISEMAGMHGISRQTLILYDRKGLLKPAYVNGNGYRFYSADQIPRLRLICLLKEMGVTLAKIKSFLDAPSPSGMLSLIDERKCAAEQKIEELELQVEELTQLSGIYEHMDAKLADAGLPHIEWLPRRRAAFAPYPDATMDERKLHLSLMHAWDQVLDAGLLPSKGFGSCFRLQRSEEMHRFRGQAASCFCPGMMWQRSLRPSSSLKAPM